MHTKQQLQITLYEHETLKLGQQGFEEQHLLALQRFYGTAGVPYYNLVHNGVKFCQYVGVLKVGNLLIEVLPKADRTEQDEAKWRDYLIHMLRSIGSFSLHAPTQADLKLKSNALLELYFLLYVQEVEMLVHQGLIKQYKKVEENKNALKGRLHFPKHLQYNVTRQERFFVRHTHYDKDNQLNRILLKGLQLVTALNNNTALSSRLSNLLLHFPELADTQVNVKTFESITFNRKTEAYRKAIEIAQLLLLNFHPDLASGRKHVLALLFDMNKLWERYITKQLQKAVTNKWRVKAQNVKGYWKHDASTSSRKLRPDILLQKLQSNDVAADNIVIDTKWKVLRNYRPADDDLRQMFAYCHYFDAGKSYLLYPTDSGDFRILSGSFLQPHGDHSCGIIQVPVDQIKEKLLGSKLLDLLLQ